MPRTRWYKKRYEKHYDWEPELRRFSMYQETVIEGGLTKS